MGKPDPPFGDIADLFPADDVSGIASYIAVLYPISFGVGTETANLTMLFERAFARAFAARWIVTVSTMAA